MVTKFRRTVRSTSAYKSLVEHAEALSFEVDKLQFDGTWQTPDGVPCWPKSTELVHRGAGRKYFHVKMDGGKARIEPADADAELTVTFKGL